MPRPTPDGKETLDLIHLECDDGRAASIVLNRLAQGAHRYLDLELTGERGEITTSIGGEARLELGLRTGPKRPYLDAVWARGGRAVLTTSGGQRVLATESFQPFVDATAVRLRTLHQWITEGVTPERDARHHRTILALMLAAYESAETGGPADASAWLAGS